MAEPGTEELTPPPAPLPAPPARAPIVIATVALIIAAMSLLAIVRGLKSLSELEAKVQALEATQAADDRSHARLSRSIETLGSAVTLLSDEQADLGNPKLQHLRHGLAISELAVERKDSGVTVDGRIINASSLGYRDATFRMKVGDVGQEFTIRSLAAGASGEFSVFLPNVPLESARMATFSLVSSAVEFAH
jgi:hypothetical protein